MPVNIEGLLDHRLVLEAACGQHLDDTAREAVERGFLSFIHNNRRYDRADTTHHVLVRTIESGTPENDAPKRHLTSEQVALMIDGTRLAIEEAIEATAPRGYPHPPSPPRALETRLVSVLERLASALLGQVDES